MSIEFKDRRVVIAGGNGSEMIARDDVRLCQPNAIKKAPCRNGLVLAIFS